MPGLLPANIKNSAFADPGGAQAAVTYNLQQRHPPVAFSSSYLQRNSTNPKDRGTWAAALSTDLCTAHVPSARPLCARGVSTAAREPNHGQKEKLAAQGFRCAASAVGRTQLL